jgi:hypothetical protein
LDECSRKMLERLESAWIKGSGEDEIFLGEFFDGDGCCYLSVVLRHAGAFGNKLVRGGKQDKRLFLWRGDLAKRRTAPLDCAAVLFLGAASRPIGDKSPRHIRFLQQLISA